MPGFLPTLAVALVCPVMMGVMMWMMMRGHHAHNESEAEPKDVRDTAAARGQERQL